MMSKTQVIEKEIKILKAIKYYRLTNNLNELSRYLNIPTSSLQRYLKEDSKQYVDLEEYKNIIHWLNMAKEIGLKNGGKKSQEIFGFSKDNKGHFTGKRK